MRGGLKNKNDQFRRLVRIQTGKKGVTEDEKIRASVLRKVEESRLTNKELTVFLHICQYQTDAGTVSGIYYKDICNALKISNQSFYSSLYRLRDCGLINLWKADKIDWDIQIIGNDCTDIESVKKEGYLSVADGLFASEKFRKLKANEKVMAMRLLVYCRSGQRTYKEAKASFLDKMKKMLGCGLRAVKKYLTALKELFYIGIKDKMYLITIRRGVADRVWRAPTDTELELGHKVHAACNRNKINESDAAKRDTAELAKQYRQDIAEMQKAGVLPEDIFGYLIGKARDGLAGKLNPKYIHKVLRNEIANFQRAKKMAVASGTQAFQNFTGRTNNNYMEKVLAQWSMM